MVTTPSLLITDDDAEFRDTLRSVFEPRGIRTHLAECGEQALEIVRVHEIHLALLDMHMPRLTGLELLELLRQFRALLPCILMSAELSEAIVRQAERLKAFSVLAKSTGSRNIRSTVEAALREAYNWPHAVATDEPLPAAG